MRSSARSERLDLDRDLPTSAEDIDALRRFKVNSIPHLAAYLRFLEQLPGLDHDALREKRGPRADRPFTLD